MWLRFECSSQLISLVTYLYLQTKHNYDIIPAEISKGIWGMQMLIIVVPVVGWSRQTAALVQTPLGARSVTHGTKGSSRSDCRTKGQILMSHLILFHPFSVKVIMRYFPNKDQEDSQES